MLTRLPWAGRPLLIDTNLLLLSIVGRFDRQLIGRGRLDQFSDADFELLRQARAAASRLVTTPNVLTEVSNLAGNMIDARRREAFLLFFAGTIVLFDEQFLASNELAAGDVFTRLGLTDASIAACAATGTVVLTDDFPLSGLLRKRGLDAFNFNHLRAS